MMSKSAAFQTSPRIRTRPCGPPLALAPATIVVACCLCWPGRTSAHPEIESQLAHVSGEIARAPDRADLYLQRGQLYRVHRDWQLALGDFRHAAELDPGLHTTARAIGRLYLEADKPDQALAQLERFLELQPGDPEGLILRGRAHGKLGATLKAAADFDAALPKLHRPTPELFIERAQLLIAGGENFRARALAGLAEGIETLGDLYTLHRFAAELELDAGLPEAALRRARQQIAKSDGQLSWRILEAELLTSLDKRGEASAAYHLALGKITSLPPHRRRTPAVTAIEKSIRSALAELGAAAD